MITYCNMAKREAIETMEDKHIVLEDEYRNLLDKKNELCDLLNAQYKRMWESCDAWWDTWHDNFDFEDANLQARYLSTRIREINKVINNCRIVMMDVMSSQEIQNGDGSIKIGSKLAYEINGRTVETMMWWYNCSMEGRTAYNSPLWKVLMHRKVGETVVLKMDKSERIIKIIKISR